MVADKYTFKEICDKTGYKPSVIRYYEKEFELNFSRDTGGRRYFTEDDFKKLSFIKNLQEKGYTNPQIKKILSQSSKETFSEIAITSDTFYNNIITAERPPVAEDSIINYMEEKFKEITENISQINQSVNVQERDLLLSENAKLKMELKQKSFELMEIKEKLRYERENKKGFLQLFFSKK
jgi:DNA-binding transcriptional MerR regulator